MGDEQEREAFKIQKDLCGSLEGNCDEKVVEINDENHEADVEKDEAGMFAKGGMALEATTAIEVANAAEIVASSNVAKVDDEDDKPLDPKARKKRHRREKEQMKRMER